MGASFKYVPFVGVNFSIRPPRGTLLAPYRRTGAVFTQKKVENSTPDLGVLFCKIVPLCFFPTNMIIKEKSTPLTKGCYLQQ